MIKGELGDNSLPDDPKGEYVLIVMPKEKKELTDEDILAELKEEMALGIDKRSAVIITARMLRVSENRTYKLSLNL